MLWTHQLGNRKADLLKTEVLTLFLKMKGMAVFAQFTLWFGANLQITAIVTGALAVVLGGDVFGQSLASLLDNALVLPSWLYTQLKVQNSASHK